MSDKKFALVNDDESGNTLSLVVMLEPGENYQIFLKVRPDQADTLRELGVLDLEWDEEGEADHE